MGSVLGSIFGFGNGLKTRLKRLVDNPNDFADEVANGLRFSNRLENPEISNGKLWNRPLSQEERTEQAVNNGLGFFNPVPLGTMGNFAFRKALEDAVPSMSRRDFLKKSGGIAAGAATAGVVPKLLRKFAAEEKPIADAVAQTAKEAPKYKYNSLKDYLDDVSTKAETEGFERASGEAAELGAYNQPGYDSLHEKLFYNKHYPSAMKERLLQDEAMYNQAKQNAKQGLEPAPYEVRFGKDGQAVTTEWADVLSPQAKKEMKYMKDKADLVGAEWTDMMFTHQSGAPF